MLKLFRAVKFQIHRNIWRQSLIIYFKDE